MTRPEFSQIMAYLTAGCGKPLAEASLAVYFDLLGDLPAETLAVAAKRVLCEHVWSTFPSVAELRAAVADTAQRQVSDLSSAEAWGIAWKAVGRIDMDIEGSVDRHLAGLPARVTEAMRSFGIAAMVGGKEPLTVIRAQFTKIYESLASRDRRIALLPGSVKKQLAEIGQLRPSEINTECKPIDFKAHVARIGK